MPANHSLYHVRIILWRKLNYWPRKINSWRHIEYFETYFEHVNIRHGILYSTYYLVSWSYYIFHYLHTIFQSYKKIKLLEIRKSWFVKNQTSFVDIRSLFICVQYSPLKSSIVFSFRAVIFTCNEFTTRQNSYHVEIPHFQGKIIEIFSSFHKENSLPRQPLFSFCVVLLV